MTIEKALLWLEAVGGKEINITCNVVSRHDGLGHWKREQEWCVAWYDVAGVRVFRAYTLETAVAVALASEGDEFRALDAFAEAAA